MLGIDRRGRVRGALRRHALRLRARARPSPTRSAAGARASTNLERWQARAGRRRWTGRRSRDVTVTPPTRTPGRPPWARDLARPPPTSTRRRSTSRSRRAAGRHARRPPSGARSRWSCSRRSTRAASGATRLDLATVGARLARLGVARRRPRGRGAAGRGAARAARPLAPFVGRPGDYRPFIVDGGFLYHERDLRLEQRLAGALAARLAGAAPPAAARRRRAVASHGRAGGRTEQAAAIDAARRRSLTVISGGPGHGQDRAHRRHRPRLAARPASQRDAIAIAAPTGKAANRIAELLPDAPTRPCPRTLHRLLGSRRRRGPAARRRVPPPREPPPPPRRRHRRRGVDGRARADGAAVARAARRTRAWC